MLICCCIVFSVLCVFVFYEYFFDKEISHQTKMFHSCINSSFEFEMMQKDSGVSLLCLLEFSFVLWLFIAICCSNSIYSTVIIW